VRGGSGRCGGAYRCSNLGGAAVNSCGGAGMAGGGEDEVARGRVRWRTGEWPGGIVVQGGRGVEAAELGRCSGMAAEQEARWARRRRRDADQENAQVLEEGGG
jgi:hypothetical protein